MVMTQPSIISLLTDDDLYLFNQGSHFRLYEKLGAHLVAGENTGTYCAVWAPDAEQVFVMGDFNQWHRDSHALTPKGQSGIWEGFFPDMGKGALYKYRIVSRFNGYRVDKADPLSIFNEVPPKTASIVWDLDYTWSDREWMASRHQRNRLDKPMAIYEMHLGSWRRIEQEGNRSLSYRELAPQLADYLQKLDYTHVEFMPVMDHPFFGSWGYQITGFFAPSGNFGTPQDLMYLIDYLHQRGIGVILDWVPSHFPSDEHGPAFFDGTHLYEHADSRQGYHPEWNSFIFNYGFSAPAQCRRLRAFSLHANHRRGIHRLADGVATDLRRRPRLRPQMGHGLDARHAAIHVQGTRASPLPSRQAHVPNALRLS